MKTLFKMGHVLFQEQVDVMDIFALNLTRDAAHSVSRSKRNMVTAKEFR